MLKFGTLILVVAAFGMTVFNLFKPLPQQNQATVFQTPQNAWETLPPYFTTWNAVVETLKDPKTAIFGVGPDNFVAAYTRGKSPSYNRTELWNINFTQGRSFLLQLWAEAGLLGLLSFLLLVGAALKHVFRHATSDFKIMAVYLTAALVLFPPAMSVVFLLYIGLAKVAQKASSHAQAAQFDLSNMPAYGGLTLVLLALVVVLGYLLGRSYAAEFYFKKYADSLRSGQGVRNENLVKAIQANPRIERFRAELSVFNLLAANQILQKYQQQVDPQNPEAQVQVTDEDRRRVADSLQAAISEAKAQVALNPNKATSWERLAFTYRNLLNLVQGADSWTVASYQRAIILDPQNPIYRLNLGGVFYGIRNFDEAIRFFQQAISLKPDWPNAHYNLAWASYQKEDFRQAVLSMENVLRLLEEQKNSEEYKKAQTELEQFRQQLPAEGEATPSGTLDLPNPPEASIEPKLQLPESASPSTR